MYGDIGGGIGGRLYEVWEVYGDHGSHSGSFMLGLGSVWEVLVP